MAQAETILGQNPPIFYGVTTAFFVGAAALIVIILEKGRVSNQSDNLKRSHHLSYRKPLFEMDFSPPEVVKIARCNRYPGV